MRTTIKNKSELIAALRKLDFIAEKEISNDTEIAQLASQLKVLARKGKGKGNITVVVLTDE